MQIYEFSNCNPRPPDLKISSSREKHDRLFGNNIDAEFCILFDSQGRQKMNLLFPLAYPIEMVIQLNVHSRYLQAAFALDSSEVRLSFLIGMGAFKAV